MYILNGITNAPLQTQSIIMTAPPQAGNSFSLTIYWVPLQYGWFITNLTYGSFVLQGLRICNSPNMLYQFMNQIPFGLACYSTQNREPSQQNDFSSGASILYLLSQAECQQYQELLQNA